MPNTRDANYVLMSAADIAEGRYDPVVQPGWAMGPFFPTDDLRCTDAFEIKNWDQRGVRKDWKNHPGTGSEYILVTQGTLTVALGDVQGNDGAVIETERTLVPAGHAIVLRAGIWRRYECSPDALGITVRRPSSQHSHADEKVATTGATASTE